MANNLNNLNIITFIKDIYSSLKHIDNCFNSYKESIDSKLIKLEDNQNTILDRLNNIEQLLYKINSNTEQQVSLDKNIENELLEKMNTMNKNNIQDKLNLKPEELTFANILENGYSINDINQTLQYTYAYANGNVNTLLPTNMLNNYMTQNIQETQETQETLENLLF
jgi:hypothetical protein